MAKSLLRLFVLFSPAFLFAHDTWLIPSAFRPGPGIKVQVRLATGEAFPASEVAATPDRIARFTLRTATSTQVVEGYRAEGAFLVAEVSASQAGSAVVVVETKPRALELDAKTFNEYLQAEELKEILRTRAQQGQSDSPGRERYRKIAKTIVCVGEVTTQSFREPDGLWLEIVPETNPCGLRVGDAIEARAMFQGKPLAGGRLVAGYEGVIGHHYPIRTLTDAQGRASVRLDRPGVWFLRILHMVPASGDAEADWHSAFSTLTFEVGP